MSFHETNREFGNLPCLNQSFNCTDRLEADVVLY